MLSLHLVPHRSTSGKGYTNRVIIHQCVRVCVCMFVYRNCQHTQMLNSECGCSTTTTTRKEGRRGKFKPKSPRNSRGVTFNVHPICYQCDHRVTHSHTHRITQLLGKSMYHAGRKEEMKEENRSHNRISIL